MVERSWEAHLGLRFGLHDGRTVVRERTHRGPLQVQRAFYPEGPELCHQIGRASCRERV